MQNKTDQILSDLAAEYADVLFHTNTKVRKIPKIFTDKVSELKKSGVSFDEMGKSFKVRSKTVRKWVNKNKAKNHQDPKPKRLYIKKTASSISGRLLQGSRSDQSIVKLLFN